MRGFCSTRTRSPAFATTLPDWIKRLERPAAPVLMPKFGPLEGIRAVGTGVLVAQPYIGTKLAEFGAEVIHVERPGGDTFRFIAPLLTRGPREHGCDEAEVGKNKLSMGIDLRNPRGAELLMALWKISDIWMESSAPGTLERAGLTAELALAINPRLVIVRISTYGQYGKEEYLGRPGYDALAQAFGGMINVTGDPSGPPQRAKVYTGDYITALTGWAATMMALWEVNKTGRGQVVDLAQFEAVAQTMGNCMPLYTGQGGVVRSHRQSSAVFPTLRYVQVRRRLGVYRRAGRPDGEQTGGVSGARSGRVQFRRRFRRTPPRSIRRKGGNSTVVCGTTASSRPALDVETELNKVQVGCARIFNMRDQYEDEHYNARDMTVPVLDHQSGVPIRVYGVVPKMSLTPGRVWRGAPSIGQDTSDILSRLLNLDDAEIARLYEAKAVHRTEPFLTPQVDAVHP